MKTLILFVFFNIFAYQANFAFAKKKKIIKCLDNKKYCIARKKFSSAKKQYHLFLTQPNSLVPNAIMAGKTSYQFYKIAQMNVHPWSVCAMLYDISTHFQLIGKIKLLLQHNTNIRIQSSNDFIQTVVQLHTGIAQKKINDAKTYIQKNKIRHPCADLTMEITKNHYRTITYTP